MSGTTTQVLQGCLDRLRAGDPAAKDELLRHGHERLRRLAHRMLDRFPNVRRWEETDDVLQQAYVRINRMLDNLVIGSVIDYLRLAAANVRRQLIDLARHYSGPCGIGANHATPPPGTPDGSGRADPREPADPSGDPHALARWTVFHELAAALPDGPGAAMDLLWYHDLTQEEAAGALGISVSTLKRHWQEARLKLMDALGGESPFS